MADATAPSAAQGSPPASKVGKIGKVGKLLGFVIPSFGPLVVFYGADYLSGLRVAILCSVIWSVGEVIVYRLRKKPITLFFKFSATITILFGCIDVYLQKSVFFKYEGAMTNLLVGGFFLATLFADKTLLQELAEAQQNLPPERLPELKAYFAFLTVLWTIYFWLKAGLYAWLATIYSIEKFMAIRTVIGNVSMIGLLGISVLCAKPVLAFQRKRKERGKVPVTRP